MAVHARPDDERPVGMSDAQIIAALQRGDEAVFASLVERYHRALVRLARAYVHDASVAEDVAQDAWLGFLQGLSRFAGRSSLKTWLFSILVNCARASRRKEGRSIAFSLVDADVLDSYVSVPERRFHSEDHRWAGHWADPPSAWPEDHALEEEFLHRVEEIMTTLPAHQRVVITMRDIEGWSSAEVCEVLDITETNQRVLLHRARSRIRGELERYLAIDDEGTRDAT